MQGNLTGRFFCCTDCAAAWAAEQHAAGQKPFAVLKARAAAIDAAEQPKPTACLECGAAIGPRIPDPAIWIAGLVDEQLDDYLGFGCVRVGDPVPHLGRQVAIIACPPEHADWMLQRLASGMKAVNLSDQFTFASEAEIRAELARWQ